MEIGHGGVRFLPNLSFHLALPLLPRPTPVIVFDVLHLPSVRRHIEHEKGERGRFSTMKEDGVRINPRGLGSFPFRNAYSRIKDRNDWLI